MNIIKEISELTQEGTKGEATYCALIEASNGFLYALPRAVHDEFGESNFEDQEILDSINTFLSTPRGKKLIEVNKAIALVYSIVASVEGLIGLYDGYNDTIMDIINMTLLKKDLGDKMSNDDLKVLIYKLTKEVE